MTYKRVLIPILGDSSDQQALELAASVAESTGTELSLVYVVEVAQEYPLEADLPRAIDAAERALQAATAYAQVIFNGSKPTVHAELLSGPHRRPRYCG
ncbi:MAG: universal stress protein [Thermomicrobiales bacterium]